MSVPGDNCDSCGADYDITHDNAKLFCFLEFPKANHVEAVCPNNHSENIFLTTEAFMYVLNECKLNIVFALNPSVEFMQECIDALGEEDELIHTSETPKEIEVPHYLLRELYDQMREYEATN